MAHPLFAAAESSQLTGWRRVFIADAQVAARFLNERGKYRYGLFELAATSLAGLEAELVQHEASGAVNFAIIDTTLPGWSAAKTSAFRHDLDFHVFTGATAEVNAELRAVIGADEIAAVLCMSTPLR